MQNCSLRSASGRWVLLASILTSSTVYLVLSGINIALPSIQSAFKSDLSDLQWIVDAQLLSLASLLLIGGSLGDKFGRKKILIAGLIVFGIAAILSAISRSVIQLIVFQSFQGIGAALMIPQVLAVMNVCFPENERGQAIGIWAGISGGIGAIGPWFGGWLVEHLSWQSVFFMSTPFVLATIIIAYLFVPKSHNSTNRNLDWSGTLLILLGILGIAYGLISGPGNWTSLSVLISLTCGAVALMVFFIIEARVKYPLIPLSIFKNPLVAGANTVTLLLYFALNGVMFLIVLNLQQVQEYSPATAGLALLPTVVLITLLSGPAGIISDKIGPRFQMILSPMLVASGTGMLAFADVGTSYFLVFFPGLLLIGTGMAFVIAPLTKSALSVSPELSGAASGINNAAARIAALFAVAVLGLIMVVTFKGQLDSNLNKTGLSIDQKQQILLQHDKLGGIIIPDSFDQDAASSARQAISSSFVSGFRITIIISAVLAFISGVISIFTIRNKINRI